MKIKFYSKLFVCFASGMIAFSLCGCSNNKKKSDDSRVVSSDSDLPVTTSTLVTPIITTATTSNTTTSSDTTSNTTTTSDITSSTTTVDETYNYSEFTQSTTEDTSLSYVTSSDSIITDSLSTSSIENYTENDNTILNYFSDLGRDIKETVDDSQFLAKGKSYFVYCIDFLFYDGEIKGIKFSDLTDSAKQQLLTDITTIDSLICSKFPNYKDDISEGSGKLYNKASDIIKSGSKNINDFSKDKLGQENYDKLKEYKDMFMETAFGDFDDFKDILEQGKEKIKSWYEGLK